ncbi:MAG TPA: type II secretion system protein GspL [Burkholderiales bacterium]|nr:type II secretion system protein GspL [Burkholderiales bacterium]
MSLLRIYASLLDPPQRCQWALVDGGREPVIGEGRLAELPRRAENVQLVVPAAQVLFTRARVPQGARRRAGSALAFAVEEKTAGEPDANQVSWLGAVGDEDALAVADKEGLERWRQALGAVGIRGYEVHCETLFLPWRTGEWSLAWNGNEGFVRTGEFEGTATDCGDPQAPPLSLRLILEEAQSRSAGPTSIAIHPTSPEAAPDIAAWQNELGIALRLAAPWDWRTVPPGAGVSLAQERQRWRPFSDTASHLRPAAWILGAALALHAVALVVDWTSLANEQRTLRKQMELRFRATFPEAVAVVDPVLQMRRKLAESRHAAGQSDSSDFLPMVETVMTAMKDLPEGGLRVLSYESGRMSLEIAASEAAAVNRIVAKLTQSGMSVERSAAPKRAGGGTVVLTVRAS